MDKFLHILGAVSELERTLIRERQKEGIAKAKACGVYKGRKSVLTPDKVAQIEALLTQRNPSVENYKKSVMPALPSSLVLAKPLLSLFG